MTITCGIVLSWLEVEYETFTLDSKRHSPAQRNNTPWAASWQPQECEIPRGFPHFRQCVWQVAANRRSNILRKMEGSPPKAWPMTPIQTETNVGKWRIYVRYTVVVLFLVNECLISPRFQCPVPTIQRPSLTRRRLHLRFLRFLRPELEDMNRIMSGTNSQ